MVLVKGDGDRELPPEGLHSAVLVDVVDLGVQELIWQGRISHERMVQLRFQIAETLTQGKYAGERFMLSRRFTAKLGEKASLRKFLESWAGKKMSNEVANSGIDLDKLIGRGAQLLVVHDLSNGTIYANIQNIMPLAKGQEALRPLNYIRVQDRPKEEPKSVETGFDQRSQSTGFEGFPDAVPSGAASNGHGQQGAGSPRPSERSWNQIVGNKVEKKLDDEISFDEDTLPF